MESNFVSVDSISIDLPIGTANKTCEHFTIRGYVSDIRKKDWRKCWPFPMDESDNELPLPPLEVPKFRWWGCENCQQATANEINHGNDQTDVSHRNGGISDCNCSNAVVNSGTPESPVASAATPVNAEFDLNIPIDLTGDTDGLPVRNEIENNNAEIVQNRITDHDIGSEINLNHQVSSVTLPEARPDHMEECHINKIACEANVDKSPSDINEGTPTSEENQCHNGLRQSGSILRECTVVVGDNIIDHATEHLSPELADGNHDVSVENEDEIVRNHQGRNVERSTSLTRRRPRKMRLLKDLLNENGEAKTDKTTASRSLSHGPLNQFTTSEVPPVFQENEDVPVDSTLTYKGRGRKRKFVVDEESTSADMCSQRLDNEIQNPGGVSRTDNTAGKRHKSVPHVDKHLISRPQEGQWRKSGSTVDVTNKENLSESPSGSFPCASTEKGKDDFPLHMLRNRNVCNSKGKGKMPQADAEMDSITGRKNDKLVEGSFAHTASKNLSSRPECIAVPSTKGTSNGKELNEERHLPLKGYPSEQICNKQNISQKEIQLREGTSRAQLRNMDGKAIYCGARKNPSKDMSNAILEKGKEVYLEGTNGDRNNNKMIEVVDLDNSLERCDDLTAEDSDHGSEDDIPMEVVEILARNQYERSLPDVENLSCQLEMSVQREKDHVSDTEIGINRRQGNAFPRKENSSNYFSSSALHQFPFGFEVPQSKNKSSNGSHYSPSDTRKLGPAQTPIFNRRNADSMALTGESNGTEHDRYQSVSHDTYSNEAIHALHLLSLTGAGRETDTSSTASRSAKMVRRPSNPGICSANLERETHGSPRRQISEHLSSINLSDKSRNRLFDSPISATSTDQHGGKIRSTDFRDQNLPRYGNGIKMNGSNAAMQNVDSLQLRGANVETETSNQHRLDVAEPWQSISGSTIVVNRNPAEFTAPEDGNPYMINGEDLKFEDIPPNRRRGLPAPRGRKQMKTRRLQNERR
ncbi:protein EMBRYONIC FLOWER 1-like [Arachis ipaensis]|uniref:protein EMBRYONIC FLOWER 1-like n=1 Tax=Arachis ipaensis TaxID=130454 RepID=UPI000A2B98B2|nr:protein EMBRYONIC FLOWER 1-like [Arachis ipaensis]